MADRFLCEGLMKSISELLFSKFSMVYALKIYMWALRYQNVLPLEILNTTLSTNLQSKY